MALHDDIAIFTTVIRLGGFSRAANHLGLSNGLISRRIAALEAKLGVSLIKRTTRQLQLTSEGKVLWQHAQRMQQEMDSALTLIHSAAKKPRGIIRVSAPLSFGRNYLTPITLKFLEHYSDIQIDLMLSNELCDSIHDELDLIIRGTGYLSAPGLKMSSMQGRLLFKDKIGLYASPHYLGHHGEPRTATELQQHLLISCADKLKTHQSWLYTIKNKSETVEVKLSFNSNDLDSCLAAVVGGLGIGKFTELSVKTAIEHKQLQPILNGYAWGDYTLHALYAQQNALPKRTRLFLDFLCAQMDAMVKKAD